MTVPNIPGLRIGLRVGEDGELDYFPLSWPDAAAESLPSIESLRAYIGSIASAYSDEELGSALLAETSAQSLACRLPEPPDAYPADLVEALKRRVARNLY